MPGVSAETPGAIACSATGMWTGHAQPVDGTGTRLHKRRSRPNAKSSPTSEALLTPGSGLPGPSGSHAGSHRANRARLIDSSSRPLVAFEQVTVHVLGNRAGVPEQAIFSSIVCLLHGRLCHTLDPPDGRSLTWQNCSWKVVN